MPAKAAIISALRASSLAHRSLEARQSINTTSNLTDFIATEYQLALTGAIANIGGTNQSIVNNATVVNGSLVGAPLQMTANLSMEGPFPGIVVASPSTYNPDYFYTWTRDSALTMLMLADETLLNVTTDGNNSLNQILLDYTEAQAKLQTLNVPSGLFYPAGQGLGEPKFYTNMTRYAGTWGRPQNDGPALRATTLMEFAYGMLNTTNATTTIYEQYWPIILNDLNYVGQYWNTSGYDLWEEVNGNSFFTTTAQHRALVQGAIWAELLNTTCEACDQAPQIACFLANNFWNETGNYLLANINANQVNRSQINCDPILAAMHAFDINATCDATALQPCNPRTLATHKVWVDTFRNLYPINENKTAPNAVLTGRYPEDTYYDGNPWFITTLAAAEVLYDAVAQISQAGTYDINNVSLAFFQDIYPSAMEGTYSGDNLTNITDAMMTYADGFVTLVQNYTVANGSLSEQINKTTGEQTSASALTWSFAAFVTMAERRAGNFPPPWGAASDFANDVNATCVWSYYNATYQYKPAEAVGASWAAPYSNTSGCLTEVGFYVLAPTKFGQNVYIAGNNSIFNNSLENPIETFQPLLTGNITAASPTWYYNTWFPAGETVGYLYVLQNGTDGIIAENMTRTVTAPACGEPRLVTNDTASLPKPAPSS